MSLTPEKQALVALRRLRARLDEIERAQTEPIAIIGAGCRFPGGVNSPSAYWELLRDGVDAISEVPPDRWDVNAYYDADPDAAGKMQTRHGGFVRDIDRFDPQFFGIAPREAVKMDPQHRLLLEVAWEALEDAGQAADRLGGSRTGVFLGLSSNDYVHLLRDADPADLDAYNLTGNAANFAAGRLSYLLGLQGPSMAVDTACSSSLVAVHLATQALRRGECRMALAGGANAILVPDHSVLLSKAHMLAPDGRCKTFDASADGYSRGEGCGIVVLKRLSAAVADGDRVLAVIRGSAVNQDGRSSGLTVPNGPAQEALIREALESGKVDALQVGYVEAHGSGTSLGDPIEVRALNASLGQGRAADRTLLIGSAKTNLGHLEAAAGIAGLIKVVLSVQHAEIPAHLHVTAPNPHIPWRDIPVAVARTRTPWPAGYARRTAGVSSFGASGTNAHLIVEEAPAPADPPAAQLNLDRPIHLLALSAKSAGALRDLAGRWARHLRVDPAAAIADAAFTANAGRAHFAHRLGVVAATGDEAAGKLEAYARAESPEGVAYGVLDVAVRPKLVFMFTGQGAQYAGMGQELYTTERTFRETFDRVDAVCAPLLGRSLREVLFADPPATSRIDETGFTQPALFAVEIALAELLRAWGVEPSVVLGHSVGGYAAATIAGILTIEDAAALVTARGQLMQSLPQGGAMAAVFADEASVQAAIAPFPTKLSIAALNGDGSVVISGAQQAVAAVVERFAAGGIRTQPLRVSHAFHSPLMDPVGDAFIESASAIGFGAPRIACVSDTTGEVLQDGDVSAAYWRRHLREPVRFAAALKTAYERGCRLFVEIGPTPTLSGIAQRQLPADAVCIPTLRRGRNDWQQLLECLRSVYVGAVDVDWQAFDRGYPRRKVSAPTYPFERQRYWPARGDTPPRDGALAADPWEKWLYTLQWQKHSTPGSTTMPLQIGHAESVAQGARREVAALADAHGLTPYWTLQPLIDALCRSFVVRAFGRLGWDFGREPSVSSADLRARAGVLDRHTRLFDRMFEMLENDQVLRRAGSRWEVVQVPPPIDPAAEARDLLGRYPEFAGEIELVARCGNELAAVLRGESDPMELLFPQGSLDQLERVYQDAPGSRVFNSLIRQTIQSALEQVPRRRAVRILEVGAGTGSTAGYVLPVLNPSRTRYTFTDVSNAFLIRAKEKFAQHTFLDYRLLDIAQSPEAQGFAIGSFDVIVASHVLHATPDLRRTLDHVAALLAPGGLLILLESTQSRRFLDLTFGMTEGWWNFSDPDVRPASALVSAAAWRGLLASSGFSDTAVVGDVVQGHESGAAVIIARRAEQALVVSEQPDAGRWLILADEGGTGDALAHVITACGGRSTVVKKGHAFERQASDRITGDPQRPADMASVIGATIGDGTTDWSGIVHLWGLDETLAPEVSAADIDTAAQRACGSVLSLVQSLVATGSDALPRLTLISRGAQPVAGGAIEPAQAMVWGLGRVVAREHPELRCTCVDLDPGTSGSTPELDALYEDVLTADLDEDQLALRGGELSVARLAPRPSRREGSARPAVTFTADGAYLVTGGLGGVGLLVAEHMVARGARHLVLSGRSAPSDAAQTTIRSMERQGARIDVVQASVADREALAALLRRLEADRTPLRGVIHSAGAIDDGVITQQNWERFRSLMEAKVQGAWNLHVATEHLPLEFFVLFSTSASILGPPGQSNHAAANAFLDALAHQRQRRGLPGVSINWGPWSRIGAAARGGAADRGETHGLGAIDPDQGLRVLDALLGATDAQVAVLPAEWARMAASSAWRPPLLRAVMAMAPAAGDEVKAAEPAAPAFLAELEDAPPLKRWPLLLSHVAAHTGRVLGLDPATLDARQGLRDLGLDSLMALELRNRLQRAVAQPLRSTLAFDYPTIDAIARHLADDVLALEHETTEAVVPADTGSRASEADMLQHIEDLSDEEVERLFAARATP